MENTDIKTIQWFPGHMAKTRRAITANMKLVDAVVEIIDARTPMSSRNPEIDSMTGSKPRIVLLNECDLADSNATSAWVNYLKKENVTALAVDCKSGKGSIALRKKVIKNLSDLTFENVKHITVATLLELIDRNFGGGWDSISSTTKDIINSAFEISTTQLPASRIHAPGGTLELKVSQGFEVLEITKGTWVEAIFAKKKEPVEKVQFKQDTKPYDSDEDGDFDEDAVDADNSEYNNDDEEDEVSENDDTFYSSYAPEAEIKDERLGYVGKIKKVNISPVIDLLEKGYIPVVSTIGCDKQGNAYNINGDTAAAFIAGALGAQRLIMMTDIDGILRDKDDSSTIIPQITISEIKQLKADGTISGGMIPKVDCCVDAIHKGVKNVVIMDGRVPHSILMELLTDEGAGTMVSEDV